jgi:hypothetical protein
VTVRTDGEVRIPEHKWYQLIDAFTRMDEELEVLIKQVDYTNALLRSILTALGGIAPSTITVPETPVVTRVEIVPNNRYKVFKLDLSVPRTDEPLGILDMGVLVNTATVVRMDSPAYWRRNDPRTGDLEELSVGYHVNNFQIRELYITNPVGSGYLTVIVEWRE